MKKIKIMLLLLVGLLSFGVTANAFFGGVEFEVGPFGAVAFGIGSFGESGAVDTVVTGDLLLLPNGVDHLLLPNGVDKLIIL